MRKLLGAMLACGIAATPLHASLIRYDFAGTLSSSPYLAGGASSATLLGDSGLLGSAYTGFVTFATDAVDTDISSTAALFAAQDFAVTIGALNFTPTNATGGAAVQSGRFVLSFVGSQDVSPSVSGLETTNFLISGLGSNLALSPVQLPSSLYGIYGQGAVNNGTSYDIVRGGTPSTYSANMVAAPESSTWILMLGGFGLVGWAMRGRRKARAHAPSFI